MGTDESKAMSADERVKRFLRRAGSLDMQHLFADEAAKLCEAHAAAAVARERERAEQAEARLAARCDQVEALQHLIDEVCVAVGSHCGSHEVAQRVAALRADRAEVDALNIEEYERIIKERDEARALLRGCAHDWAPLLTLDVCPAVMIEQVCTRCNEHRVGQWDESGNVVGGT